MRFIVHLRELGECVKRGERGFGEKEGIPLRG